MVDFASIASKKVEDVERPPLPPVGTYRFRVMKIPAQTKSQDEKWEFVRFPCKVIEATDDVEVGDYPGDVTNIMLSKTFMFDTQDEASFEQSLFNLKQFCTNHLQCVEEGMSIAEMLNNTVNAEFLGTVRLTQDKRDESGETFNAEIGRTAPVE